MANKDYRPKDHRNAYEAWVAQNRSMTKAESQTKVPRQTLYRWAKGTFSCEYGCPYHGWDDLSEKEIAAKTARLNLIEKGNHNPVDHAVAMREAVHFPVKDTSKNFVLDHVDGDLEMAAQLQLIYNKGFYHITGLALDFPSLYENLQGLGVETIQEFYGDGSRVKPSGYGDTVRTLLQLMDKIDQLTGRGAFRQMSDAEKGNIETEKNMRTLTVEDIMKLRSEAKKDPLGFQRKLDAARVMTGESNVLESEPVDAEVTDGE